MAPLGLLMDNRLSYQHSVGRQWFNDYAKDCSMSDAEEVDEVRDILGKGGDSRVPHSLQAKTMKVRRREDGTPYAIYGEVGFRYQDPLPWIDEEELCCVIDQLKESSDEGDQVKLAELTRLTNSSFYKLFMTHGPNIPGAKTRRPKPGMHHIKLHQHILVMRALHHGQMWTETIIEILEHMRLLIPDEVLLDQAKVLRESFEKQDKVAAKHILRYRTLERRSFEDLSAAIEEAINNRTFTPIETEGPPSPERRPPAADSEEESEVASPAASQRTSARLATIKARDQGPTDQPGATTTKSTSATPAAMPPADTVPRDHDHRETTWVSMFRDGSVYTVPPDRINMDDGRQEPYGDIRDRDVRLYGYSITEVGLLGQHLREQRSI
jgi:hypothetical protein